MEKPIDSIGGYLKLWHRYAGLWQTIYTVLGVTATTASLVVASFAQDLGTSWIRTIAFVSALAIGLIGALDLRNRGKNYRAAWRHLNPIWLKFQSNNCTEEELIKAYGEAEGFIGNFDVTLPAIKGNGRPEGA
ncbi:MAG: hypothetical protein U9R74_02055 [Pseudomonadota bacterium]|nr:hypothetical protein [Pseudomonadota bacterium]